MLAIPFEVFIDRQRPVQPYYVIMRLPGEQREEFVLLLPYTPNNKDNMSNWLAARSDGAHYGELVAYKYPKDKLIFGPLQIEARIDQNEQISQQFTLWNQSGSRVIRGNMLVIPVGQSNLYVEPIYLQADQGSIPEMKRVIMATGNSIVMEQTVSEALAQLFGGPMDLSVSTTAPAPATTTPTHSNGACCPNGARGATDNTGDDARSGSWSRARSRRGGPGPGQPLAALATRTAGGRAAAVGQPRPGSVGVAARNLPAQADAGERLVDRRAGQYRAWVRLHRTRARGLLGFRPRYPTYRKGYAAFIPH